VETSKFQHRTSCGYPDAACVKARPELICQVHGAVEVVPEHAEKNSADSTEESGASAVYTGVYSDPDRPLRRTPAGQAAVRNGVPEDMTLEQTQNKPWYADFAYDRRAPTCCIPWQWKSGQV